MILAFESESWEQSAPSYIQSYIVRAYPRTAS